MFRSALTRAVPVVAVLSLATLSLTACNTITTTCDNDSCHVKVSVDPNGSENTTIFGTRMSFSDITASSVTVSAAGNQKSVSSGSSTELDGFTIKVNSLSDGKADLTITRVSLG